MGSSPFRARCTQALKQALCAPGGEITVHPNVPIASLVRRPACGLAKCRRRTWLIFTFGQTLWIDCFNFFNVCTYRSELIVAPLSKNSTNKTRSLTQKSLPWLVVWCGGLSPMSSSLLLMDPVSKPTSMASSSYTVPKCLWISIGMEPPTVRNYSQPSM